MASPRPTELLYDAIEATRAALRDLKPDEVPVRLRRVKASSERTLPPPLAAALVRELDSDSFLRDKALEAWAGERPPETGPALASYVYLEREPGWERTLLGEAVAFGGRRASASDQSLEIERDSLAAEVAGLREQLKRQKDDATARERELSDALEAQRAPGRAEKKAERRLEDQLRSERIERETVESELRGTIADLEREARRLQERARAERATRAGLAASLEASSVVVLPTDPTALARHLDEVVAHTAALVAPSADPGSVDAAPGDVADELDRTLPPDRAEVIDWLVGADRGPVVIDGYNLGFQIAGLDPPKARALAVEVGRRLAAAAPLADVTVVFDSTLEAVEDRRGSRAGNLVVIYTSGEIADDLIVEMVCAGRAKIVITNDRELRHRAEGCGAIALWSDALVEWSRRR